jgi:hypothetical protein
MRKMMKESAVRGQTIRTETAPVREASIVNESEALGGRKMGGGPKDMSASLKGPGRFNDTPAGSRSDGNR